MAGERTFVVKILGNADSAITAFKNLAREGQESIERVQSIGGKLGDAFDVVKKGAFVALGALTAVGGAAAAAVAAAAADEASQKSLEGQLIRSAGATTAQVQATEAFIEKAMMATGIADDELRPAFGNLVRATNDLTKSQTLFQLSLDISAATGRDLEAVTLGLGRAATGNIGALTRLGIPLDEGAKKSKDFAAILETLQTQFGGAAATAADTFSGRVKILKTSLGEVVESIGYALLPTAERLVKFLQENLVPALQAAARGFKDEGVSGAIKYFAAAFGQTSISVLNSIEGMILGFVKFEQKIVDTFKIGFAVIDFFRAFTSAVTGGDGIITVEQMLINRTENVSKTFDNLRASVLNTRIAMNLQGNSLSPLIDQTDRIGTKVLPKAKEASDLFADSLTKTGGSAKKASKAVDDSKKALETYTSALNKVTSGQKAFESAQKATAAAKKQLSKRDEDLATAQERFNKAVAGYGADSAEAKDAQKKLAIAQRNVEQAGYRVEEAVFAVSDAEKKLAEVRKDPESSPQMIREAEINLAQAKLAVKDAIDAQNEATDSQTESQSKLNEVVNGAIVGSVVYESLLKELNDAKDAQAEASDNVAEAVKREAEAYKDLADAIRTAALAAGASGQTFTAPTLPTVPTPTNTGTTLTGGRTEQGTPTIVINTGIGTNGVEAGRQIVGVLQEYTKLDRNAIAQLVSQR